MRVTWAQPEDLLRQELRQSTDEGRDVTDVRQTMGRRRGHHRTSWPRAPRPSRPRPSRWRWPATLLDELDAMPAPGEADEPSDWPDILAALSGRSRCSSPVGA